MEASRGEETALMVEKTRGRVCEPLTRLVQSFLLTGGGFHDEPVGSHGEVVSAEKGGE